MMRFDVMRFGVFSVFGGDLQNNLLTVTARRTCKHARRLRIEHTADINAQHSPQFIAK
jgi:hypothetical protein